jgi:hypothetical protein
MLFQRGVFRRQLKCKMNDADGPKMVVRRRVMAGECAGSAL